MGKDTLLQSHIDNAIDQDQDVVVRVFVSLASCPGPIKRQSSDPRNETLSRRAGLSTRFRAIAEMGPGHEARDDIGGVVSKAGNE